MNGSLNFKEYEDICDVNEASWDIWENKAKDIDKILDDIYISKKRIADGKKQIIPVRDSLLVPLLYGRKFKPGNILFVGMNPSFNVKGFEKIIKTQLPNSVRGDIKYSEIILEEFYNWDNRDKFIREVAIDIENEARNVYDEYFKKFKDISEFVFGNNEKWKHIDLFFIRMTSQAGVLEIMKKDKEFEKMQLEASLSLIKLAKPSVIVVANAGAVAKLSEYCLLAEERNDCDYRFLRIPGAENIPVFTVSMLTGQRALDKGSLHLLKRCVKRVVDRNKIF